MERKLGLLVIVPSKNMVTCSDTPVAGTRKKSSDNNVMKLRLRLLILDSCDISIPLSKHDYSVAARRSWVLRGVVRGFSKEARTRGFPPPSFGGFGFVVVITQA